MIANHFSKPIPFFKVSSNTEVPDSLANDDTVGIDIPMPRPIDRHLLVYRSTGKKIRVPRARHIERDEVNYLQAKLSVLEQNIHSAKTPGEKFFPRFEITKDLEKKADQRIAQYPDEQKRSAVLPLLHEVQHRFGFISPESIDWVAAKLEIEPIKVVEVVTFFVAVVQAANRRVAPIDDRHALPVVEQGALSDQHVAGTRPDRIAQTQVPEIRIVGICG